MAGWADWGKTIVDTYNNYSSSQSGSGGGGSGNIWSSLLGGLGGAASALLSADDQKKVLEFKGKDDRRTSLFEAELVDYYEQLQKQRKRTSLESYTQYSGGTPVQPAVQVPTKPTI